MAGFSIDWLSELPQGNLGLWLLFLATLGGFVTAIYQLWRRSTYIEFDPEGWELAFQASTGEARVIGRVTVVSPAARIDGTCRLTVGKRRLRLPLVENHGHLIRPNTLVLTFSGQAERLAGEPFKSRAKITVRMSDGSKKTRAVTIEKMQVVELKQPKHTDGADKETPQPAPEAR